uniref:G patch domain-containing protein n=1 Tax=Tetranychus urticae TaxID=32264 RepID=T1JTS5_TETUR
MDDEDEEFVYGTPLPPLEDNENASKKPELDLTVRDWKGRRRFHGAFTGGFSAGYFNTVGTEKGWIPSQYVSKKEERWDKKLVKSKPEDFMDDEDFSLFGIAPKKVHTKDDFKGPQTEAFAGLRDPKASLTDVLRDIIKPTTQSIGVRLFTAMKRGRRYKGAFLKPKSTGKVYGCSIPPEFTRNNDENDDFIDEPIVQAEIFSLPYTPKNDFFGIGYKPLKSGFSDELEKAVPLTAILSGNKRLKITGEAFGYGALEDDDDYADDALIYSKEDLSNYDFEIGSIKKNEPKPSTSAVTYSNKGSLLGFVKVTRIDPLESSKSKLPEIPKNWRPHPPFLKSKRASRWNQPPPTKENYQNKSMDLSAPSTIASPKSLNKHEMKPQMNANARAIILGEEVDIVVGLKKTQEKLKVENEKVPVESDSKQMQVKQQGASSNPLSAYFANKFVRSSELTEDKFEAGLTESSKIAPTKKEAVTNDQQEVKSTIGLTNRETFQWHPHTLLCKRFNVPHPYPQFPDVVGVLHIGQNTGTTASMRANATKAKPQLSTSKDKEKPGNASAPPDFISIDTEEIVEQVERPPLDLFKAIFASDESDTDEESEKRKDDDKIEEKKDSRQKMEKANSSKDIEDSTKNQSNGGGDIIHRDKVIEPKSSSSRVGIFSGINLDLLSKSISYKIDPKEVDRKVKDQEDNDIQIISGADGVESESTYGPALPPMSDDQRYTARSNSRKRKEKKRKKSKSKSRHKSKRSKKKHRRRSSSSSGDSSDSDNSNDTEHLSAKKIK